MDKKFTIITSQKPIRKITTFFDSIGRKFSTKFTFNKQARLRINHDLVKSPFDFIHIANMDFENELVLESHSMDRDGIVMLENIHVGKIVTNGVFRANTLIIKSCDIKNLNLGKIPFDVQRLIIIDTHVENLTLGENTTVDDIVILNSSVNKYAKLYVKVAKNVFVKGFSAYNMICEIDQAENRDYKGSFIFRDVSIMGEKNVPSVIRYIGYAKEMVLDSITIIEGSLRHVLNINTNELTISNCSFPYSALNGLQGYVRGILRVSDVFARGGINLSRLVTSKFILKSNNRIKGNIYPPIVVGSRRHNLEEERMR